MTLNEQQDTASEKPGSKNSNLHGAKKEKNDEFYTQIADIERELKNYQTYFQGKVVFCNCDDPEWSNFYKYFTHKFEFLGLSKLVTTHYAKGERSYKLEYFGKGQRVVKTELLGDGDFRSEECLAILKEVDVVVTNPPFSLFREYVAQLIENDKKFLIIGNNNAITYKEIFKYIKETKLWLGYPFQHGNAFFSIPKNQGANYASGVFNPETGLVKFRNIAWFTNIPHEKRNQELLSWKTYAGNELDYPKYDNYDAIEVSKVADIPGDYMGCMGVPITFLDKFNPAQFEILGITDRENSSGLRTKKYTATESPKFNDLNARSVLLTESGYKQVYARILIKRKK